MNDDKLVWIDQLYTRAMISPHHYYYSRQQLFNDLHISLLCKNAAYWHLSRNLDKPRYIFTSKMSIIYYMNDVDRAENATLFVPVQLFCNSFYLRANHMQLISFRIWFRITRSSTASPRVNSGFWFFIFKCWYTCGGSLYPWNPLVHPTLTKRVNLNYIGCERLSNVPSPAVFSYHIECGAAMGSSIFWKYFISKNLTGVIFTYAR